MKNKTKIILLVEDDHAHAEIVMREFESCGNNYTLKHLDNGRDALNYICSKEQFANTAIYPTPELIILDLQLPEIIGIEVLNKIKNDSELRKIPVIILTSSKDEADIAAAYKDHANSYLIKPSDAQAFSQMLQALINYWLNRNTFSSVHY